MTEVTELATDALGAVADIKDALVGVQRAADIQETVETIAPKSSQKHIESAWDRLKTSESSALTTIGRWLVLFDVYTDVDFAMNLRQCARSPLVDPGQLSFVDVLRNNNWLGGAYSVTVSPDGKNVYVASSNDDAVAVFSRDADDSGKLSFVDVLKLYGAKSVTVSPDGNNVYVATSWRDAVAVFSRDADDSGKLSFVHVLKDGVGGVDGLSGASCNYQP